MASAKSSIPDVCEPTSDEKVENSQNDIKISAPKVILNNKVKDAPNTLTNTPVINEFRGPKNDTNAFLNVPKQSSLNSLQVSQMPIGSATGNPRNKIALRPGYSLMDWIRLTKTPGKNLSGVGGRYRNVSVTELKQHSTRNDAWMALNGLVFNVSGKYL